MPLIERVVFQANCDLCNLEEVYAEYCGTAEPIGVFEVEVRLKARGWKFNNKQLVCPYCVKELDNAKS